MLPESPSSKSAPRDTPEATVAAAGIRQVAKWSGRNRGLCTESDPEALKTLLDLGDTSGLGVLAARSTLARRRNDRMQIALYSQMSIVGR